MDIEFLKRILSNHLITNEERILMIFIETCFEFGCDLSDEEIGRILRMKPHTVNSSINNLLRTLQLTKMPNGKLVCRRA